jgi:hypothetical protein
MEIDLLFKIADRHTEMKRILTVYNQQQTHLKVQFITQTNLVVASWPNCFSVFYSTTFAHMSAFFHFF